MPAELFANGASTTLAGNGGSITAGATSFSVADASAFPQAVSGTSQFRGAFVDTSTTPPTVLEYVTVGQVTGNTMSQVTRASEDASRFPAGSRADGIGFYQLVTANALAGRSSVGQAMAFSIVLGG